MFYERKIKYLDLYDKGERVQNAGFVRLEAKGDEVNLQIRVERLGHIHNEKVQIIMKSAKKEAVLGELTLEKGNGMFVCEKLCIENIVQGIGYGELSEMYMKLSGEKVLKCMFEERRILQADVGKTKAEESLAKVKAEESSTKAKQEEMSMAIEASKDTVSVPIDRKPVIEKTCEDEVTSEALMIHAPLPEPGNMTEQMPPLVPLSEYEPSSRIGEEDVSDLRIEPAQELPDRQPEVEAPMQQSTMEDTISQKDEHIERKPDSQKLSSQGNQVPRTDFTPGPVFRPMSVPPLQERLNATTKWQQLSDIYQHIRPFEDERDYLKIKPEDFVILAKKYYPLITNSFLKHGYYNYQHLILSREMHKDGEHYYIGVPGNFYDKEKQIAVLFGFESFEGKTEPAKSGDFGYYMITVEI